MISALNTAPLWFLVILTAALLVLVMVTSRVFYDMFKRDAEKRDEMFDKLFELVNGHETRLSHLEGAHKVNHGG